MTIPPSPKKIKCPPKLLDNHEFLEAFYHFVDRPNGEDTKLYEYLKMCEWNMRVESIIPKYKVDSTDYIEDLRTRYINPISNNCFSLIIHLAKTSFPW